MIGSGTPDAAAWAESIETVAKADREWLRTHPEAKYRRRLVTPIEVRAVGCHPLAEVVVMRGPDGSQIRMFTIPAEAKPGSAAPSAN